MQSLSRSLEQQIVNHGLVLIGNVTDRCRQREHDMVVIHRQQFGLPRFQPTSCCGGLALRTVAVATGVVGDLDLRTVFTAQHVTAEHSTAAALNG